MLVNQIKKELRKVANKDKAEILKRFFKTEPGQYGAGDKFLGVVVPEQRKIARKYFHDLELEEIESLLHSPYHEERLTALISLVEKFKQAGEIEQKKIYQLYLKNTKFINNWDLVDLTAPSIVGAYTFSRDRKVLYRLAKSKNLWERRIAILSTFYYIKQGQVEDTFCLADNLLVDQEDLMHKAVGWMLRETGHRHDFKKLKRFLMERISRLPRTTLRYAIEHFPEAERKQLLNYSQK